MGYGRHKGLTMRITKRAVGGFAIAAILGGVVATVADTVEQTQLNWRYALLVNYIDSNIPSTYKLLADIVECAIWIMPPAIIACLVAVPTYTLILRPKGNTECRCRKCGYILKGISEPKCSECGEPI